MVGIILTAHDQLADAFLKSLEKVVGPQERMVTVNFLEGEDIHLKRAEILKKIHLVKSERGVLILTDMLGGVPSNLALSALAEAKVEVIAGMNLPMLIKLVHLRDKVNLEELAIAAQEAGRKYIHVASHTLACAHSSVA